MGWLTRTICGEFGISRFLQSSFNILLMRCFPKFITRFYIYALGRLFFGFQPRLKNRISVRLSAVRDQGLVISSSATLHKTLQGILAHYYEKLFIAFFNFRKVCRFLRQRVAIEKSELLNQALSRGRGVIVVTGHYGAVEFLPLTLALRGYPVTMLLRFKTRRLKESLTRRAGDVDIELVDVENDRHVIFRALKALKANRILITECDEFERWSTDKRNRIRFLGAFLSQDRSLEMLQRRSKAPAVVGLVHRKAHERYRLCLHALDAGEAETRHASISQQALSILEQYIQIAPHQWYQWSEAGFILADRVPLPGKTIIEHRANRIIPSADPIPNPLQA